MFGDIVIANVIASGVLVLLIYIFDLNEKEPPWTLVRLYVFAILATYLFGTVKGYLFNHFQWQFHPLFNHFFVAGFCEEFLKLLVILLFVWPLKSFNEETDGIVYYLVVAAGFSVLENIGYSYQFVINPFIAGVQTGQMSFYHQALQRIVLFRMVSGHIFFNIVSGYFLGLAKKRKKTWLLLPGFFITVLLHGFWNHAATNGYLGWFALGLFILDVLLFVHLIRLSFYHKFTRRLKERVLDLKAQAVGLDISQDVQILMQGIVDSVKRLRQMEGSVLVEKAKEITEILPAKVDEVPVSGDGGLIERLLRVNRILYTGIQFAGWRFWITLFFMFSFSGFLVLMILLNFMVKTG